MTSISQYLRAERIDTTEPASFYVPGLDDWAELKSARGIAGMAARSRAPDEVLYSVDTDDVIEH